MKVRLFLMLAVLAMGTPNLWADDTPVENTEQTPPRTVTITISPETTYITEPLLPDGRVDYYGAMHVQNSVGITKENNIAAGIISLVPGERESSCLYYPEDEAMRNRVEDYRQRYWKCLGFDAPPPIESLRFLDPRFKEGEELEYLLKYYTPEEILARLNEDRQPQEGVDPLEHLKQLQEGDNSWWLRSAINYDWYEAQKRFWTDEDYPLLADWNATMGDMEQKLIEISKRPKFYNPIIASSEEEDTFVYSALLPYVQAMRETARFMSLRGNWHFARGEYDEAFECAFASLRIGLGIRTNNCFIVEDLVGIAICGIAHYRIMTYLMALEGKKDNQWLAAKRAEFAKILKTYSVPEVPKWINWERCGMLSAIQMIDLKMDEFIEIFEDSAANEAQKENKAINRFKTMLSDEDVNYDWDKVLRLANEYFDELEDVLYLPGFARKDKAFVRLENRFVALTKELETRSSESDPEQFIADSVHCLYSPALRAALSAMTRTKFDAQAVDVTFALTAYRSEHGNYPETLDELVPKYLDAVPISQYTDKPMRYLKRDNMVMLLNDETYKLDGSEEDVEKKIAELENDVAMGFPQVRSFMLILRY